MFNWLRSKVAANVDAKEQYRQLVRKASESKKLTEAEEQTLGRLVDDLGIDPSEDGRYDFNDVAPTRQRQGVMADIDALKQLRTLVQPHLDKLPAAAKRLNDAATALRQHEAETEILIRQLTAERRRGHEAHQRELYEAERAKTRADAAAADAKRIRQIAWNVAGEPEPGAPAYPQSDVGLANWIQETARWESNHERHRLFKPNIDGQGTAYRRGLLDRVDELARWAKERHPDVDVTSLLLRPLSERIFDPITA